VFAYSKTLEDIPYAFRKFEAVDMPPIQQRTIDDVFFLLLVFLMFEPINTQE
jgi:hypothetical protein